MNLPLKDGDLVSGWWLGHPSEKYESQLGWLFQIYGKIKNVPNHQPVYDLAKSRTARDSSSLHPLNDGTWPVYERQTDQTCWLSSSRTVCHKHCLTWNPTPYLEYRHPSAIFWDSMWGCLKMCNQNVHHCAIKINISSGLKKTGHQNLNSLKLTENHMWYDIEWKSDIIQYIIGCILSAYWMHMEVSWNGVPPNHLCYKSIPLWTSHNLGYHHLWKKTYCGWFLSILHHHLGWNPLKNGMFTFVYHRFQLNWWLDIATIHHNHHS